MVASVGCLFLTHVCGNTEPTTREQKMTRKPVRLAIVALVAVLSVAGLSQTPASAKTIPQGSARGTTGGWCC